MSTPLGSKTKYRSKSDVDPDAQMICGRTGIKKKFGQLTDDDIALMISKGSKFYEEIPPAALASKAATASTAST